MIISINGYGGSGKDAVAKLIQSIQPEWQIKKWAGKLKEIASILTGIPAERFEDQNFKKTNLNDSWNVHGMPMTVRELLQKLGTDGLRTGLHPNVWINALMSDYYPIYDLDTDESTYPKWIITDTRFPNEAKAVKNAGGITVRIDRPGVGPINNHISEIALDEYNFDYYIYNGGDLDTLKDSVVELLNKIYEKPIKRKEISL